MKRFLNIFLHYPVSLLTLCVIVCLSLFRAPGDSSLKLFEHMDKVVHFLMYAFLSTVMWYERYKACNRSVCFSLFVMSLIVPVLFSGLIEYLQDWLTDYRSADFMDFVFNAAGVLFANAVCFFIVRPLVDRISKRKEIR